MDKLDEGLKTLLDLGKRRGFLTFDQVNDYLPDEATSPERIHGLLETLDEMGIELINEDEAESRLLASGDLDDEPDEEVDEPAEDEEAELTPEDLDEISRRIDDPVRMYLTQMGEIPLLTREQEINLAKRIEITRKKFRRKVLECHFALALVVDVLKKVNEGELPFDRTVKVSVTENLEKDQILGRMPHNLVTLNHLMECNVRDFKTFVRERDETYRRSLLENLKRRRCKAVNLVEELSIRTQKV
jgi:RNA polymerase primary sigma factor